MSLSVRHKQNAGLRITVNVSPRRRTCVPVKCRQRLTERRRGHYRKHPSSYPPIAVRRFYRNPSTPGRKTTRTLLQISVLVSAQSGTSFLSNPFWQNCPYLIGSRSSRRPAKCGAQLSVKRCLRLAESRCRFPLEFLHHIHPHSIAAKPQKLERAASARHA